MTSCTSIKMAESLAIGLQNIEKKNKNKKHRKEPPRDPRAERLLGTDHYYYFFGGGEGGLENFDLNCLQWL